jgi:hypothetical protein
LRVRHGIASQEVKQRADNSTRRCNRLSEVTDKMHGLLMDWAGALIGCVEGSPKRTDVIEAYERQRWPSGKIAGGKG